MYITTSQLENELADIEKQRFYLAMVDRWTDGDYALEDRLWKRKREIEETLKERGNVE